MSTDDSSQGVFAYFKEAIAPGKPKREKKQKEERGNKIEQLEGRIAPAIITATLTDNRTTAQPGDTIHYTEIITSDGTDSLLVALDNVLSSGLTFVPGSLNVSPLAINDTYSAIGNTQLFVNAAATNPTSNPAATVAGNVLSNDIEFQNDLGVLDTFVMSPSSIGTFATTGGGTITLAADGTFGYTPAVGFSGADTFVYTITDDGVGGSNALTGTGTITINVSSPIWYVKNDAAPGGTGTSISPFDALSDVSGASGADAAGDIIYLYTGAGNYTGGITLLNNQTLWGQGEALVVGGYNLQAAGTDPVITNAAGSGVTLAQGNTLKGFTVANTTVFDITNTAATSVGTLTISNVLLNGTGGLVNIDSGGTLSVTFDNLTTTSAPGHGINLVNTSGTFSSNGFCSIAGVTGTDLRIEGAIATNTVAVTIFSSINNTSGRAIDVGNHATGAINIFNAVTDTHAGVDAAGAGIFFHDNTSGTLLITGGTGLNTGPNTALTLSGNSGTATFSTSQGLDIDTTTGTGISITGGGVLSTVGPSNSITTTGAGTGFLVGAGSATITTNTDITGGATARLIDIQGHTTNNITFSGILSSTGTGIFAQNNTSGTVEFSNASKTLNTAGNTALTLTNNAGATFNFTGGGLNIDTTTATAINMTGGGTLTISGGSNTVDTTSGGTALLVGAGSGGTATVTSDAVHTTSTGRLVDIQGHTANTITLSGNLNRTTSSANEGILVSGNTGGTINFTGTTQTINSGTGIGVNLTSNTGATINFTGGGLDIDTTSAAGFNATGGGTISIQGAGNSIASTTGTALNVVNTTIGSAGLTFVSISANGGASGIVLNTTGSGGLTVTGSGTTDGSGGTIQNTIGRGASFISASNISLKNMTFTNAGTSDLDSDNSGLSSGDNLATNAAIHLQTITNVTLDNVDISGGAEQGINGNTVANFQLLNSTITNVGNAADEDNIHFFNMSGTSAIINTTLTHTSGGGDDNFNLQTNSGNLDLTISGGSAVGSGGGVNQLGSGYLFGIRGTTVANIYFEGVSSTNNFSGGIVADAYENAVMNLRVNNSTSSGNNDQLSVSAGDNASVDLEATGNTLSSVATGDFVPVNLLGSALDTGYTFDARLHNNTITVANNLATDGMTINNAGGGTMNVAITNNTFDYAGSQRGILLQTGSDGAGILRTTVTGNSMDIKLDGTSNALNGILAQSGVADPQGAGAFLDLNIGGAGALSNTFTHSLGGTLAGGDIRVRQRFSNNVNLDGYGGAAGDTAAVAAYLDGRNTEVSASTASLATGAYSGTASPIFITVSVSAASVLEDGGANLVYTFTRSGSTASSLAANFAITGTASAASDFSVTGATTFNSGTGLGTITFNAGSSTTTITVDPTSDSDASEFDEVVVVDAGNSATANGSFARGVITDDSPLIFAPETVVQVETTPVAEETPVVDVEPPMEVALPASEPSANPSSVVINDGVLSQEELDFLVDAAIARWMESGLTQEQALILEHITFSVSDLPGLYLGEAGNGYVTLDTYGAGVGWFVDATPGDDSEFVNGRNESGNVDALTAVLHEMGHALGLEDIYDFSQQADLMYGFLHVGERRLPVAGQAEGAIPHDHHEGPDFALSPINIGTLPAGKTLTINYDATVATGITASTVSAQANVTWTGGSLLTDDPDAGGTQATITAIDLPDVTVSVNSAVDEDGATNLTYTFTRPIAASSDITINFSVGGSAVFSSGDYTQTGAATFSDTTGTVVLLAGQTTVDVVLNPTADTVVESNETAILTVTSGTGYEVAAANFSATGTINNDDTDVSVAVTNSPAFEDGATNLVYTFTRAGVTTGALTVNFSVGGTASDTTDYAASSSDAPFTYGSGVGTVTFGAGQSTATVTLNPTADTTLESNETAILTVTGGSGYNVAGSNFSTTGTITDEDADVSVAVAPSSVVEDTSGNLVYTFTRSGYTAGPLTVSFNVGGSATFTTDYTQSGAATFDGTTGTVTFLAGNNTTTLTLTSVADPTGEPNEDVSLTLVGGASYNAVNPTSATGTIQDDDTSVTVAVAPGSVAEDGSGTLVYTFTRVGPLAAPLTVDFNVGGDAAFGTDYTQVGAATFGALAGTVTFGAGSNTATVTLSPTDDTTVELDETAVLTVVSGSGYVAGGANIATGTITNDDTDVTVTVSDSPMAEDAVGNMTYTFTRNGVLSGPLTINFTVGGSATFTTDYTTSSSDTPFTYTATTGSITFADGQASATLTLDPVADNVVEADETAVLTVAAGSGYNVAVPASATGTINNDDAEVTVAVSPSSVGEDNLELITYTFTRTGFLGAPLTIDFTAGGTATKDTDYTVTGASFTGLTGSVTFGIGSSTVSVFAASITDSDGEPDETVQFSVVAGSGYSVGTPSSATVTIENDDTAVSVAVAPGSASETGAGTLVYTFTRTGDTSTPLTVNFTGGGLATFNNDYILVGGATTFDGTTGTVDILAGDASATVTFQVSDDLLIEGTEDVVLSVATGAGYGVGTSPATGNITDNDSAIIRFVTGSSSISETFVGTSNITVEFIPTANGASGSGTLERAVSVDLVDLLTGSATFGSDFNFTNPSTLTFAALSSGVQTLDVGFTFTNDTILEGSEIADLGLNNLVSGNGTAVTLGSATHTLTITDNETATVTLVSSSTSVTEGDGPANISALLTITGNGTAGVGSLGQDLFVDLDDLFTGSATPNTDYSLSSGTFGWSAGATGGTADVAFILSDDRRVEGTENVLFSFNNVVGAGAISITGGTSHTVTIFDNDTATIAFASGTNSVDEAGGSANVGVALAINAIGSGTIDIERAISVNVVNAGTGTATAGAAADYTFTSPTTVTFGAGAVAGTQNVSVAINDDRRVEGSETVNFVLNTLVDGTNTQASLGGTTAHTLTINDNDSATIALVSAIGSASEGAGTTAVGVALAITASGAGTIDIERAVSVNVVDAGGGTATAGAGNDYTFTSPTTVTFAAGAIAGTQNVTITLNNDRRVEGSETVNFALNTLVDNNGGQTTLGAITTEVLTITDNDTATLSFASGAINVSEAGVSQNVGVTLAINATGTGTVDIERAVSVNVVDQGTGTATAGVGNDYTYTSPTTVTFAAGAVSGTQNVSISLNDDRRVEGSETINLGLNALVDGTTTQVTLGSPSSAVVTIADNDTATLSLTTAANSVGENVGTANVGVTLAISAIGTGTIDIQRAISANVANLGTGTATSGAGNDFTYSSPTTVTFAANAVPGTQNVAITVNDDRRVEGSETINLALNALNDGTTTQASLGAITAQTLSITDNDTATIGYVEAATSRLEDIAGVLSEFVLTINGVGSGTPGLDRTVTFNVTDLATGTATVVTDFTLPATASFSAGAANGATVFAGMPIIEDRSVEGAETINIGAAIVTDGTNGQVSISGAAGTRTITITDNDTATIGFVSATSNVGEGAGNDALGIVLNISAIGLTGTPTLERNVTVNVVTSGGTAAGLGTDYSLPGLVTFTSGSTHGATQTANLAIINDALVEGSETAILGATIGTDNTGGQVSIGGTISHTTTIIDNDTAVLSFPSPSTSIGELGLVHTVPVTLTINADGSGTPTLDRPISVDVTDLVNGSATGAGTDYSFTSPATVTFSSGSTAATQSVSVFIVNDSLSEGDEIINFSLNTLVDGTGTQVSISSSANAHAVTIIDNDIDLLITSTESIDPVIAGSGSGNLVYIVTLQNVGLVNATGIVVGGDLTLPSGVAISTVTASSGNFSPTVAPDGQWTLDLGIGQSATLTIILTADSSTAAGTDTIGGIATVTAANQQIVNTGDDSTAQLTSVTRVSDLAITKLGTPSLLVRGQDITYTITVTNNGVSDVDDAVVTDTFPAVLNNVTWTAAYTNGSGSAAGSGNINEQVDLAAGGTVVYTVTGTLSTSAVGPSFANTASVASPFDLNSTDNDSTATTIIYQGIYAYSPGISFPRKFAPPQLHVIDAATGLESFSFMAYESTFRGSIRIAVGDLNGDGFDDVITTTAKGTGRLRVFDGVTGDQFTSGPWAGETAVFDGIKDKGAFVAAGDVTDDGTVDIIVGSAKGGGKVRVFDGATGSQISEFRPFGNKFKGGVRVAVGDVNDDGIADLITGQGYNGATVNVYDGFASQVVNPSLLQSFKVGTAKYKGGVSVAVGDISGDGIADVIVGRNYGRPSQIEAFSLAGGNVTPLISTPILPFDLDPGSPKYRFGVRVATVDVNFDGIADIIAGSGGKAGSRVKIYDGVTHNEITARSLVAYPAFPNGALFVAGSSVAPSV